VKLQKKKIINGKVHDYSQWILLHIQKQFGLRYKLSLFLFQRTRISKNRGFGFYISVQPVDCNVDFTIHCGTSHNKFKQDINCNNKSSFSKSTQQTVMLFMFIFQINCLVLFVCIIYFTKPDEIFSSEAFCNHSSNRTMVPTFSL
jgi:hypothetical protein